MLTEAIPSSEWIKTAGVWLPESDRGAASFNIGDTAFSLFMYLNNKGMDTSVINTTGQSILDILQDTSTRRFAQSLYFDGGDQTVCTPYWDRMVLELSLKRQVKLKTELLALTVHMRKHEPKDGLPVPTLGGNGAVMYLAVTHDSKLFLTTSENE